MVRHFKTYLSHAIVNLQIDKKNLFIKHCPISIHISISHLMRFLKFLTISDDRGLKPTVKPSKTRGPGFSHGMASSTKALQEKK